MDTQCRFDAALKGAGGCSSGETCFKTRKVCSFDDGLNTIAPAILEEDAVAFTMPVYRYTITAQIKDIIDRYSALWPSARIFRARSEPI